MRRSVVLAGLLALLAATACSGPTAGSAPAPGLLDPAPSLVPVERRTLTSVVTLDAEVVASPRFVVGAPRAGRLQVSGDGTSAAVVARDGSRATVPVPKGATAVQALLGDGTQVSAGLPVLAATYPGFAVRASVAPERIYRLLDGLGPMRAQVTDGPGPFPCVSLGDLSPADGTPAPADPPSAAPGAPSGQSELTGSGGVSLSCAAPTTVRLLVGSPALLAVTTGTAKDALVVPVEAVTGLTQQGTVGLVKDGRTTERTVTLGLSDGRYVQVLDGLALGDRVSVPAPSPR